MIKTIPLTVIACLLVFAAALGLNSCVKEKADKINPSTIVQPIDVNGIRNCHLADNPYPSQISANIEGTWVWVSKACIGRGGSETFSAGKYVVITFNDGGLYKVFEDSKLVSEGTWTLSQSGNDAWNIVTTSPTTYLHGNVWLCNNEVVFSSGYVDGCDYYFTKK